MSNTPHQLTEEFPAEAEAIQALKASDAHFARLVDEYQAVNDAIHRAETNLAPVTPEHETELRRKRLSLKDQIAAALRAAV